jgi:Ferric reductase NAD binding domain
LTGFVAGPYGVPPKWEAYETLILISASTGASFTVPILESILNNPGTICTQRIKFLLVVRYWNHSEYYVKRLSKALANAEAVGILLDIEIAVTGDEGSLGDDAGVGRYPEKHQSHVSEDKIEELNEGNPRQSYVLVKTHSPSSSTASQHKLAPQKSSCCAEDGEKSQPLLAMRNILYSHGRPNIANFIRNPVELTGGETSIAVCGGKSLVATVRNSVASLSNERAIHKGTGAQGLHLYVEEYCF